VEKNILKNKRNYPLARYRWLANLFRVQLGVLALLIPIFSFQGQVSAKSDSSLSANQLRDSAIERALYWKNRKKKEYQPPSDKTWLTEEEFQQYLREQYGLSKRSADSIDENDKLLEIIRRFVETEDIGIGAINKTFGAAMTPFEAVTSKAIGKFRRSYSATATSPAASSCLPIAHRFPGTADWMAGDEIPGEFNDSFEWQSTNASRPKYGQRPAGLKKGEAFHRSTLSFPLGTPGFDGSFQLMTDFDVDPSVQIISVPSIPVFSDRKAFEFARASHNLRYTFAGPHISRAGGIAERGALAAMHSVLLGRPGWNLEPNQTGQFLLAAKASFIKNRQQFGLAKVTGPYGSSDYAFSRRGQLPSRFDDELSDVTSDVYFSSMKAIYRGKKGTWTVYQEARHQPWERLGWDEIKRPGDSEELKQRPNRNSYAGCEQWTVVFRPHNAPKSAPSTPRPLHFMYKKDGEILRLLNETIKLQSKDPKFFENVRKIGYEFELNHSPSNLPMKVRIDLKHPLLEKSPDWAIPSSGLFIEPLCRWKEVKETLVPSRPHIIECEGDIGYALTSLHLKKNSASCIKPDRLLSWLRGSYRLYRLAKNESREEASFDWNRVELVDFSDVWAAPYGFLTPVAEKDHWASAPRQHDRPIEFRAFQLSRHVLELKAHDLPARETNPRPYIGTSRRIAFSTRRGCLDTLQILHAH
jgi:hypothetical protein